MDWGSLIGAGVGGLGSLLSGGQKTDTSTSTQQLSPELQAAVQQIFAKIPGIFNKSYPQYTGERVAQPTDSRTAMNPLISQMSNNIQQSMTQGNPYQGRINQVLDQAPTQISVPDLLGRNSAAGAQVMGGYQPVDKLAAPSNPWTSGLSQ